MAIEPSIQETSYQWPITAFDLVASRSIISNLHHFHIRHPTPVQMQSIPIMLHRRHVLVSAPTGLLLFLLQTAHTNVVCLVGSGKTLAFALPVVLDVLRQKEKSALPENGAISSIILEPTKELAEQVHLLVVSGLCSLFLADTRAAAQTLRGYRCALQSAAFCIISRHLL